MKKFLFDQPDAFEKLNLVSYTLSFLVIILLILGPYDNFYVDTADWLFSARFPFYWFPNLGVHFWTLKYLVILFAVGNLFLSLRWFTAPLFALTFLFFNFYVTCFSTTYWLTNTHLNFFAILLCFVPAGISRVHYERASFILAFMITYIALLYFQAGFSKLLLGGVQWFVDGKRIWTETILLGTPFGKWLTQWPVVFKMMSMGTAVFELFLPPLFFFNRTRHWVAALAILFHMGTFAIMGISFWYLWTLYPAIFFYGVRKGSVINSLFVRIY